MMIHPANIVYCLLSHIVKKLLINRIKGVSEFKFGPQKHPFLIGNIIDKVGCVSTSGPNTKHVLIPRRDRVKQLAHLLLRHAWPKRIGGDKVGTFRVELMAVDFKMPLLRDYSVSSTGLSITIMIKLASYFQVQSLALFGFL